METGDDCDGCYWHDAGGCGVPDDMEADESMKCYVDQLIEEEIEMALAFADGMGVW